MFLVYFTIFIRYFTTYQDFWLGTLLLFSLWILIGGVVSFLFKIKKLPQKKKKTEKETRSFSKGFLNVFSSYPVLSILWKQFFLSFITFLLAGIAVGVRLFLYSPDLLSSYLSLPEPPSLSTFSGEESSLWQQFLEYGIISDISRDQRYIFQDTQGREYLLFSEKVYHIGDTLQLSASLKPVENEKLFSSPPSSFSDFLAYEFNYDKRLMMKGLYGSLYEKFSLPLPESLVSSYLPNDVQLSRIQQLRATVQLYAESVYGKNRITGLLLGILIGDKSLIPETEYQKFVQSGLVHIIAVSGGNIALVVVLLSFLLKRIPFYIRNGLIIVFVIIYAMLCGLDSSVMRATVMGVLTLLALFGGREVSIWRVLRYAFVGLLLFNPFFLVYDLGFLLSFSAVAGIVLRSERIEKQKAKQQEIGVQLTKVLSSSSKKIPTLTFREKCYQSKVFKEYLSPALGATLGTLPILLFFMGEVNLTGFFANILIAPLIPLITVYGFLSLLLYRIFPRQWILFPEKRMISFVYFISDITAKYGVYVSLSSLWMKYLLCIFMGGVGIHTWRSLQGKKKGIYNAK